MLRLVLRRVPSSDLQATSAAYSRFEDPPCTAPVERVDDHLAVGGARDLHAPVLHTETHSSSQAAVSHEHGMRESGP